MLVLGFDTSTPTVTVALYDGASVLAAAERPEGQRHAELLAPAIAAVLAETGATPGDLTHVAVGVGPGPFTGLRVGLMTARAMTHALSIPLLGVVSHDALAAAAGDGPLVVVTDARRKEVYWSSYDDDLQRVAGPGVERPVALAERLRGSGFEGRLVGAGAAAYRAELADWTAAGPDAPSGGEIAALAVAGRTADVAPLYLRRPDAVVPGPPKPVLR